MKIKKISQGINRYNFYKNIKDNPAGVIDWCEEEIKAYKELIKVVQKSLK